MAPPSRLRVALALATVYLVWSSTYLALRWVVAELPALSAAGARFVVAGLALLGFARLRAGRLPPLRTSLVAAPIGVLIFAVGSGFVAMAQREVTSGTAAVACASIPCLAAAMEVLGGKRAHRRELLGIALGLAGVLVLHLGNVRGSSWGASTLLLLAPTGWALGSVLTKRYLGGDPLGASAVQMIAGGLAALALGAAFGEVWPGAMSLRAALAFAYLLVVGSLVAFSAYVFLLHHTRVGVATSYAFVNPVLALLIGSAIGGEALGPTTVPAIALVLAGLALVLGRSRAREEPAGGVAISAAAMTPIPASVGGNGRA